MPNYEVVLKTVPATLIASRRVTIPTNDQVPVYLDAAYQEVRAYAQQHGAKEAGACFALWHQPADVYANEDAEAALPIDHAVSGSDRVQVYELPAAQVAAVVHYGSFENFTAAHGALLEWIEANGYRIVGPYREFYLEHHPDRLDESAAEIQYPVEKN